MVDNGEWPTKVNVVNVSLKSTHIIALKIINVMINGQSLTVNVTPLTIFRLDSTTQCLSVSSNCKKNSVCKLQIIHKIDI